MSTKVEKFVPAPSSPPPVAATGVILWLRTNLFSGWFNSVLTILAVLLLVKTVPPLIDWAFIRAVWTGGPQVCDGSGACWAFIADKARVMLIGTYPQDLEWRPLVAGILFAGVVAATVSGRCKKRVLTVAWPVLFVAALWLIGGGAGLTEVDQSMWGGLMLSLGLAAVGIILSVPFGILLALGRQSRMVGVSSVCVGLIELIRGVPLITILFMASVMMPLFLPVNLQINNLLRVQVGIILFSSAYIAEVVRGGLQAVPGGQLDAAKALGLSPWMITLFVVLPQALRYVLPALIGRCIALFKDTSLVIIVGLLDFLGMAKAASQDQHWLGHEVEGYVFCAVVYWCICFGMSRYGRSLEKRGPQTNR
ncbi:polar amino acid ABC transporter, inner membrane subunit [Pseudodesulfovibrio mercurii]|uniref:Polar amino acid ABC transporter, inner membrane subunit n=1 Tax=Pseudodesulfovibrio mercurii TaxID=641491 RepID=F0JH32_9BACT|nr:amino acid ABC transporter permease [Pseudodesulfovibrio mercurii]EGB13971.1 polar amino acid ABC transporter, inner membrane subunit [Pseudodesulfovibrio mercurii]